MNMQMKTCIIDASGFEFAKDGKTAKYYQIVVMTDYGYKIKKVTKSLYDKIREIDGLPFFVDALLYDEYGRVCDIKK